MEGKKPTDFSFDVAKTAEEKVKKITMDAVQSLVVSSPVDTGAYRASHIVSIDLVTMVYVDLKLMRCRMQLFKPLSLSWVIWSTYKTISHMLNA